MNVVSYSEAARIAGVSRQAISEMKKINSLQKGKYPFFKHNPDNGNPGVDVNDPSWLYYISRRKAKSVKKTDKKEYSNSQVNKLLKELDQKNKNIIQFVSICISCAVDYFEADEQQEIELKNIISEKYKEFRGE